MSLHRTQKQNLLRFLSIFAPVVFTAVIFFSIAFMAAFAWFARELPSPTKVRRVEGLSTVIYDRSGEVLYDVYGDQHRIPVDLSQIPKFLRDATIAVEDKDFYKHQGFDPLSPLRILKNLIFERRLIGGSTLTQQLVKNVLLTQERSLPRKIKEFILAVQLEKKYTKDQILQMYLNEAPYGGTAWGVETAAQNYFGKHAKDLNLTESVILAGLPQRPSYYSPFGSNPKAYAERAKIVLGRMRDEGYINADEEKKVLSELETVTFSSLVGIKAPHFVMYVKDLLIEKYGEKMVEGGGLKVTTTLDYKIQEETEKIVREEIEKLKKAKVGNGAVVVLEPKTGQILTMVGSYDYFAKDYDGNFNAALSYRQPGSAGKPIAYAALLGKNYTPSTLIMDVKTDFPTLEEEHPVYTPENYDGKFRGPVQVRFALGNSINVPAVKTVALAGVKEVMRTGYQMGITSWEPTAENLKKVGLSLALGGREVRLLDLTSAYGVFANKGEKKEPAAILKVVDSKGKTLEEYKDFPGKKVVSPEIAFLISHILLDNNARSAVFGANSLLNVPGKTVSVKTGTTDKKRDNWTIGYTPSVVAGVWVGNNDNTIMAPSITSGVTGATPIWSRIMRFILKDKPDEQPEKPNEVVAVEVDALTGGLPRDNEAKRTEYFIKGTEPTMVSPVYKKLKVSKHDANKLANDFEIKAGDFEEKDFLVFSETDPVSSDGKNRWQEGINNWLAGSFKDEARYHPPTEKSTAGENEVRVMIKEPQDKTKIDTHEVNIKLESFALRDIVRLELFIDGEQKKDTSGPGFEGKYNLSEGTHTIKARARDSAGNEGSAEARIGVKVNWDYSPPAPTVVPSPTAVPAPG